MTTRQNHNTTFDFDTVVDRRNSDSAKWNSFGEDVLPMWVADMDFVSPEPILRALHERVDHGVFGYSREPDRLRELIRNRMASLHGWNIEPESIIFLPGLVCGLNVVARATGDPGSGIMVNTPVYPPFLSAPTNQGRVLNDVPLALSRRMLNNGGGDRPYLYYEMDFDAIEAGLADETELFLLCNPHNPVGRAFTRQEQERLADFCLRHDLTICSDEIHADLLMGDTDHLPIASLDPEIADRTITLLAPSKTFNIPALGCSAAIIPNANLRQRVLDAKAGIVPHVNVLGFTAAVAAYAECQPWLDALLDYLTANRDYVFDFVQRELPEVETAYPEATYLAWLDCTHFALENPQRYCLDAAKVACNSGAAFGAGGDNCIRLNFGCPRSHLDEGLQRVAEALKMPER